MKRYRVSVCAVITFLLARWGSAVAGAQLCQPFWRHDFPLVDAAFGLQSHQSVDLDGAGGQSPRLVFQSSYDLFVFEGLRFYPFEPRLPLSSLGDGYARIQGVQQLDFDGAGPLPPTLFVVSNSGLYSFDGSHWTLVKALSTTTTLTVAIGGFDRDGAGPHPPDLFLAGTFQMVDASIIRDFARFDGKSWMPYPQPMQETGQARITGFYLLDLDASGPELPTLFGIGRFTRMHDRPVANIVKWNDPFFTALDESGVLGPNGEVTNLLLHDFDGSAATPPDLVVAGNFTSVGPIASPRFVLRSTGEWRPLGSASLPALITSWSSGLPVMASIDADGAGPLPASLYVSCVEWVGSQQWERLYRWTGAVWDERLASYAGGQFTLKSIATIDRDDEGPLPSETTFFGVFGRSGPLEQVLRFMPDELLVPFGNTISGLVHAITSFDEDGDGPQRPTVFIGGEFALAGTVATRNIVRWDGRNWSALPGFDGPVRMLKVLPIPGYSAEPTLIAAGRLTAGAIDAELLAWDGRAWVEFAPPTSGPIHAIGLFDPDGRGPLAEQLVVGGEFVQAGETFANRIAAWDGTTWRAFGAGFSGTVRAIAAYDPDGDGPALPALYAGGEFSSSGGARLVALGRWDGAVWRSVGGGLSGLITNTVRSLFVLDEHGPGGVGTALIVGGEFARADGLYAVSIARWDGSHWSAMDTGLNSPPLALTTFDPDGASGPAPEELIVAGQFGWAGGESCLAVARWTDGQWRPLSTGLISGTQLYPQAATATAIHAFDSDAEGPRAPTLFVGGQFAYSDGLAVRNLAVWAGCGTTFERGDMNCDGVVSFEDIEGFILALVGETAYDTAYPRCLQTHGDLDRDGVVTFDDIPGLVAALAR